MTHDGVLVRLEVETQNDAGLTLPGISHSINVALYTATVVEGPAVIKKINDALKFLTKLAGPPRAYIFNPCESVLA